jgi:hypothetical protein
MAAGGETPFAVFIPPKEEPREFLSLRQSVYLVAELDAGSFSGFYYHHKNLFGK